MPCDTIIKTRALLITLAMLLSGCMTPPERESPFKVFTKEHLAYNEVTLGLILSNNTKHAVTYTQDYARLNRPMEPTRADAAETVFKDITAVFQNSFRKVVAIETVEDAKKFKVDLVAILDAYAEFPNSNISDGQVDVKLAFQTIEKMPVDMVQANSVVRPAAFGGPSELSRAIRRASDDVSQKLQSAIVSSVKLAEFAKAKTSASAVAASKPPGPETPRGAPASDVDTLPAARSLSNRHAYAIVIGIEQYREALPKAEFADRDAVLMGEYLTKMLGYPEENVVVRTNEKAAKTDLEKYFEAWLPNNVEKDASIFIYYSGHGTPNIKSGEAYLVPYDGDPTFIEKTGYPLKRLYAALDKLPAKDITVVLDSCFSGAGGRSVLAQGAKPMVLSVENAIVAGRKTVVLSASAGDQISSAYMEKGHGLLTYFFLKGLRGEGDLNKDGRVELDELFEYVKPNVQKVARKQFNNEQTPQLLGSPELLKQGIVLTGVGTR